MVFTSCLCLHRNTGLVGTVISVYDGMLQAVSWGAPLPGGKGTPHGPSGCYFLLVTFCLMLYMQAIE